MVVGAQPGIGDTVADRFRIDRLIGVGGTGSVFEAHDLATNQRVAIKILHPVLQRHPVLPQRFLREAAAARALMTPHAVKVEATGNLNDGIPYIVMEFLDGEDLGKYIARKGGRLPVDQALYLADQIAAGIHEAHARGILHRDLKPENVFVIPTAWGEVVKVVDFGISKIFTEEGVKLTQTGVTVGTPQYMPVEQLRGTKGLDGRVDVYAVGVMLFEMIAGVRPYDGFTYEEVILKVATTTAPPIATYCPNLPGTLGGVIDKAIARERDQRYLSMADLRQALAPYWSGRCPVCTPQSGREAAQAQYVPPPAALTSSQSGSGSLPQPGAYPQMGMQPQPSAAPHPSAMAQPPHAQNLAASGSWGGPGMARPPYENLAASGAWNGQPMSRAPHDLGMPPSGPSMVPNRTDGPRTLTLVIVIVVAALAAVLVVAIGVGLWLFASAP